MVFFSEKLPSFWLFFDIQMAIFRRVRCGADQGCYFWAKISSDWPKLMMTNPGRFQTAFSIILCLVNQKVLDIKSPTKWGRLVQNGMALILA